MKQGHEDLCQHYDSNAHTHILCTYIAVSQFSMLRMYKIGKNQEIKNYRFKLNAHTHRCNDADNSDHQILISNE